MCYMILCWGGVGWVIAMVVVGYILDCRFNTKARTPSASHNNDYAAALRVLNLYFESVEDEEWSFSAFMGFCRKRLNAEHCA